MWFCVAYGAQTCFLLYPTVLIITVHALALEYLVTFHPIYLSLVTYAYINSMITALDQLFGYGSHSTDSMFMLCYNNQCIHNILLLSFSKAYLYPSHSCTFVVHYGILLKVFLVLQCTMECSTQEFSAHVCQIFSGILQGWNQWNSWLQNDFFNLPHLK